MARLADEQKQRHREQQRKKMEGYQEAGWTTTADADYDLLEAELAAHFGEQVTVNGGCVVELVVIKNFPYLRVTGRDFDYNSVCTMTQVMTMMLIRSTVMRNMTSFSVWLATNSFAMRKRMHLLFI